MGSGFDNGQERRRDDGLPEFPPEWGQVIIPDDPAELTAESDEVRREFRAVRRRLRRRNMMRRLTGRPVSRAGLHVSAGDVEPPTLALPLLIMAIAVIASLVSLFALSWPAASPLLPQQSAAPSVGDAQAPPTMPAVVLTDGAGAPVSLADLRPSVLVLAEMCACTALESDLFGIVGTGVPIVVIATVDSVAVDPRVRLLTDPAGQLRTTFTTVGPTKLARTAPSTGASLVLVDRTGHVVAVHQQVTDAAEVRAELTALTH